LNCLFHRALLGCGLALALSAFAPGATAHGDLHERIAALDGQILTNQSSPELRLQRADLNRQHRDFTAALLDLDQAAKLRPGWAATHLQRARINSDLENFPATVNAATDCLKLAPANADALVLRARAQARLGKFAAAAADYDAVLNYTNSAPPLPDLYLERARAQAALGSLAEAIHGLDNAQKRLGATPSFALPAIEYERQRGNFAAALERLERAKSFFNADSHARLREEIQKQAVRQ